VPHTNSLLGQSLLCFLTSRNVLEVNRILFRTPVSLVQGNVLTKTSRSSISFTLRAMGSIQESNEMLVKSDVHLPWSYPKFNRDVTRIDHIHDHRIPDPYRLLEDPKAKETQVFVENQVQLAKLVLSTCDTQEKLRERITASYDYPKFSCPYRRGDKWIYTLNTGLQAQSVVFMQDTLYEDGEVLIDPNTWSDDGTISLALMKFSEDAAYLAFGQSASGSDWIAIKVMRVADRVVLSDTLSWVRSHFCL
jgi:prolyl oligopeptidase